MNFEHGRSTTVQTDKGLLRGFKTEDVYHFYGIQYATAERFMPPVEVEPWEGVKDAINYGFICPPFGPEKIGNNLKNPHRFWPKSENCQFLNVWTKSINSDVRKPVVVYFHGGGLHYGSSLEQASYDGRNLAYFGDIVVVTLNHRLNVLGYLNLTEYGEKYKRSVNAGNLDLIAALQWVNKNIANFGGDPNNVTLFGQSGGGTKVISTMNMPAAEGLYQRAMVMSGVNRNDDTKYEEVTRDIVRKMLEMLNISAEEVYKLETMPHGELAQAYQDACNELGFKGVAPFGPVKNEDYLGYPTRFGFSEKAKNAPMMIGSVYSEFQLLPGKYYRPEMTEEEMVKAVEEVYGKEVADKAIPLFKKAFPEMKTVDLITYDTWVRDAVKAFTQCRLEHGCAPTYNWYFNPVFNINDGQTPLHSSDIPFFYHSTDKVPSADFGQGYARLVNNMSGRFINFARTGNPQVENEEVWYPCTKEKEATMVFNANSELRYDVDQELFETIFEARLTK